MFLSPLKYSIAELFFVVWFFFLFFFLCGIPDAPENILELMRMLLKIHCKRF